ncbi:hypothetical protein CHU32_19270 [Superficieibacter electus]|uniref:Uncharacterized protein n=1 Tax=Superficieibacter electus TaxID=2022662 RepID=A0A2P5GLC0_9ENTR|nr:hypothetical protein [Superficieibacter electus]POP42707.1 hypothetical protein CHU33_18895 [Superficieibacter electus]POP45783.1 hypothetical protein CHU32_19270 [Superficieibacter electus]
MLKRWKEKEALPGINCLIFSDGKVTLLNWHRVYDPQTKTVKIACSPTGDTTLNSIENDDPDCWVTMDRWATIDYNGGKIYGGDGGMGNEGALVCVDANGHFLWGFFFTDTNPITKLMIKDNMLTAINEHAEIRLTINLKELTSIKVDVLSWPMKFSLENS